MASIALGERVAAVDANVVRVLSRLRCLSDDPKSKASVALHARLAASLVDPDRPGDFNQVGVCCFCLALAAKCSLYTPVQMCRSRAAMQGLA